MNRITRPIATLALLVAMLGFCTMGYAADPAFLERRLVEAGDRRVRRERDAEGSPDFVPVPERIATFDNDGTLWAEQPMYFQIFFASTGSRRSRRSIPSGRRRSRSHPCSRET